MLNLSSLKTLLTEALYESFDAAMEAGLLSIQPSKSDVGDEQARQFAETIATVIAPALGERIACAIDYYVKSISIYGTIITAGSPVTQTAVIQSPQYLTNGKIPNSLGIM